MIIVFFSTCRNIQQKYQLLAEIKSFLPLYESSILIVNITDRAFIPTSFGFKRSYLFYYPVINAQMGFLIKEDSN